MELKDLSTFYVTGTFGPFIDPHSAITIGMLPDLPLESCKPLGNSSLGGATLALTSGQSLAEIDRTRDRITYLELSVNQDFMNRFSAAKFISHTDRSLFPSVEVWKKIKSAAAKPTCYAPSVISLSNRAGGFCSSAAASWYRIC